MSLSKLAVNLSKLTLLTGASPSTLLQFSQSSSSKSKFQLLKSSLAATRTNSRLIIPANNTTHIRFQNSKSNNFKLIDKRFKNLSTRENFYSSETSSAASRSVQEASQKSIFKRFKDAYKQHGKVLIYVHIATCFGWIIGFFALSKT